VYKSLVRYLEGKRPFVRPRHRWKNTIKIDLKEIGCEGVDWIEGSEDRIQWWAPVTTLMGFQILVEGDSFLNS
jgi:hypothetical protein